MYDIIENRNCENTKLQVFYKFIVAILICYLSKDGDKIVREH